MQNQTPAIQICQPGYDVRNCPDYAYLFNSDWPSLAIAFEITIEATGFTTIPHNLGFPPLTMGWFTVGGLSYGRIDGASIEVDDDNVYLFTDGQITVRCFNVDISKEQTYPLPQSAQAKLPYNDNFGAKIAKGNRPITSTNLNDFILHTRAQSPAVLDVATEQGKYFLQSNERHYWPYGNVITWDLIVYPLQSNFIPWNVGSITFGGDAYSLATGSAVYYDSVSNSLVLNITSEGAGSLIVLRDPLFYPNVVQAVY